MANARGPYYLQLNYHSAYAPHSHTIGINTWTNAASTNNKGQIQNWLGVGIDTKDMIDNLLDVLVPYYPATVHYDNWTIFHQPADPGPSYPMIGDTLSGVVGTSATPGWSKATQANFTWKTTAFGDFKIVLLDFDSSDNFEKVTVLVPGINLNLDQVVTDDSFGWQARDNTKPDSFKSVTVDLNDALRKQYRMS